MTKALPHSADPFHEDPFPFLELRRLTRADRWRRLALAAALHASLIALTLARMTEPVPAEAADPDITMSADDVLPEPGTFIAFADPPELLTALRPVYPRIALEAGVEGTVSLLAFIGKDGSVRDVRIESGIPMLDDAAVAAVRAARFRPALQNGEPVGVWIRIPVRFCLRS
jgi:TonB family protein